MPARAAKLRVHVASDPHGKDVFRVSPERFAVAARRHPAVARRLAVTFGEGMTGGEGLDEEPLPADSPLWGTPSLVVTPHCAVDDGRRYVARGLDIFFDNARRHLGGRPLRNQIEPELGY